MVLYGRCRYESGYTRNQKHRTSLGKSSDVLLQKYGCFYQRSPMFSISGSSLLETASTFSTKKVLRKKPHFLHHMGKCPGYKGVFGCMIGCRMPFQGVGFPHFSCKTVPKNSKMIEKTARFDSVFLQNREREATLFIMEFLDVTL